MKLHLDKARRLPGARRSGNNVRLACPVHQPGRSDGDSLVVAHGTKGPVWHCYAGCDAMDVRNELISLGVLERTGSYTPSDTTEKQNIWMRELWRRGKGIDESPIIRYFERRRIPKSVALEAARSGYALRQVQAGTGWELLAQITDNMGSMVGLHRTYIDAHYNVVKRRCHGKIKGAAIRLFREYGRTVTERDGFKIYDHVAIAEGIETALSWRVLNPHHVVWSVISANGIGNFEIPPTVDHVTVAADFDGTSISGYEKLHRRTSLHRTVELRLPDYYKEDWNDVLKKRKQTYDFKPREYPRC